MVGTGGTTGTGKGKDAHALCACLTRDGCCDRTGCSESRILDKIGAPRMVIPLTLAASASSPNGLVMTDGPAETRSARLWAVRTLLHSAALPPQIRDHDTRGSA